MLMCPMGSVCLNAHTDILYTHYFAPSCFEVLTTPAQGAFVLLVYHHGLMFDLKHSQDWDKEGYKAAGNGEVQGIPNKFGTMCAIMATAGSRINHIFKRLKEPYRLTARPWQPTASEVRALASH